MPRFITIKAKLSDSAITGLQPVRLNIASVIAVYQHNTPGVAGPGSVAFVTSVATFYASGQLSDFDFDLELTHKPASDMRRRPRSSWKSNYAAHERGRRRC